MSLLSIAKKFSNPNLKKVRINVTNEDVELVTAYLKGDITFTQVAHATGRLSQESAVYGYMWAVFRVMYQKDLIRIKK